MPSLVCAIQKEDGTARRIFIPTVRDRFVQQLIVLAVGPVLDAGFSNFSFGWRARRSAHDAVRCARAFIESGLTWCAKLDLSCFFDAVPKSEVLRLFATAIGDECVNRLVRQIVLDHARTPGKERGGNDRGIQQGGPLSPLLGNLLLDPIDKELERRGIAFIRYGDDVRLFLPSRESAHRAMAWASRLYNERFGLYLNEQKSVVCLATDVSMFGFAFRTDSFDRVRLTVAAEATRKMKHAVREKCRSVRPPDAAMTEVDRFIHGWSEHFRIVDTPRQLARHTLWATREARMTGSRDGDVTASPTLTR
jgi:group II intron reverse transcriptase/maturase